MEDTKQPMTPGVGICPTYTVSRVILSDAVALVRSDRFYTTDYSTKRLTNWGYTEVNYDLDFNQGCVFYKLFLRALPNHFQPNSIYAHHPFTIPYENARIMKDLGRYHGYNYSKPQPIPQRIRLNSLSSVKVLCDNAMEPTATNHDLAFVVGQVPLPEQQRKILRELVNQDKWHTLVKQSYENITLQLLHENSVKIAGVNQVDITRDIGNLAPDEFTSGLFNLPVKSAPNPKGIFSEQEFWMAMCVIYTAAFSDEAPLRAISQIAMARKLSVMLGKLVELHVKSINTTSFSSKLIHSHHEHPNTLLAYGSNMIRKLLEAGMSPQEISYSLILPTIVTTTPYQSLAFSQVLDYYLGAEGVRHLPAIQALSSVDTLESNQKLQAYVNEAIRLNGSATSGSGIVRRVVREHTFYEHGKAIHVEPGDKVFCTLVDAARDPVVFPEPGEVRLNRNPNSYIHHLTNGHMYLGKETNLVALAAMLRTVGKLEGLRRAPGPQGEMKRVCLPLLVLASCLFKIC